MQKIWKTLKKHPDRVVNVVVCIATLITVFLTNSTVKEMKLARELSSQPELILLPPNYRYTLIWLPKKGISPIFSASLGAGQIDVHPTRSPMLQVKNIGNSPAQKIELIWKVKGYHLDKVITGNNPLKRFTPSYDGKMFWLTQSVSGFSSSGTICADSWTNHLAYIVSSPDSDKTDSISIPLEIITSYQVRALSEKRPRELAGLDGPEIEVGINYYGTDGRIHHRKFLVESKMWFTPDKVTRVWNNVTDENDDPSNFRGDISFSVKPILLEE